jgi:hypothetical protein
MEYLEYSGNDTGFAPSDQTYVYYEVLLSRWLCAYVVYFPDLTFISDAVLAAVFLHFELL